MKGIQVLDRPASQSFYAVAGRLLFIESFDRDLAILIELLFARWQLTPVSFRERNPDIKISFSSCEELPAIPRGLSEFEVAAGGRCYTAGDEYYLSFQQSLLHLRTGNPLSVSVWISDPTDVELARVTSFAVCAALRRFGLFELHSAGVVVPETDAGVLIVGPSGSGKSTLTLQLASAGWGYLSDDEVLLSVVDEQVEARGFRSFFALAPAAVGAAAPVSAFKTCFEPADVLPTPPVQRTVPRFLLFTTISRGKETLLHELTQAETMVRLIRACPWASYDTAVARPNLELLSKVARQAKGFDLSAGTDLLKLGNASRIIGARVSGVNDGD
ncbi:MAG TPA: hypothetical protein VGJ37_12765 [Pyrinomonadaceae bacterium]|jgi:hypothetical protein